MEVTALHYNVVTFVDGDVTLGCKTENNWKTCTWSYDGKYCRFEYVYKDSPVGYIWSYDEVYCDSDFSVHEFKKPEIFDQGNDNKACKIEIDKVTFGGNYKCEFQRCNIENDNMCKTKISRDCSSFSAIITVEVS